ncbi:MAG: prepilin-type N-terminal cleavage/methylation domain-containing protein, partial [Planctomycetales bacterium]|nr:prepilin-type N-terminal cleavage/methylation domain-containing protein [Planctomycetales bacterium]
MRRGFTLLEVLVALALVGVGIIALLGVRNRCVEETWAANRLRGSRLLTAERMGASVSGGVPEEGTSGTEGGEGFEAYRVESRVETVLLEDILPEGLLPALAPEAGPGGPGSPSPAPPPNSGGSGAGGKDEAGLSLRKVSVAVLPPGIEEEPTLRSEIVTLRLLPPEKPAGGAAPGGAGAGAPAPAA